MLMRCFPSTFGGAVCLAVFLSGCSGDHRAVEPDTGGDGDHPAGVSTNGHESKDAANPAPASNGHEKGTPPERPMDLSRTSWEDPFSEDYWQATGWTFDGESMSCSADNGQAEATFRRLYRKLSINLTIQPVGEPGTFSLRLKPPLRDERGRLDFPAAESAMTAAFAAKSVTVSSEGRDRRDILKRRDVDLALSPDEPGHLSLSATGNRVQVFWNGRRVLMCNQPAALSGRQLALTVRSHKAGYRIVGMRIEGE